MMTHEISLDGDTVPIGGRTVYMFTKVAETKYENVIALKDFFFN